MVMATGTSEDLSYLMLLWSEDKAATHISGIDIDHQLLKCCDDVLRKDMCPTYDHTCTKCGMRHHHGGDWCQTRRKQAQTGTNAQAPQDDASTIFYGMTTPSDTQALGFCTPLNPTSWYQPWFSHATIPAKHQVLVQNGVTEKTPHSVSTKMTAAINHNIGIVGTIISV